MLNKKLLIIGLVATFSFGSGLAADGKVYLQQAQAEYAEYEKSYIDDDARNRAKALFEQAAQAGEVEALLKLAEIARHDNDYSKSELLLKLAIDKGSDQALSDLATQYTFDGDLIKALPWWEKSAAQGNAMSLATLGQIYADPSFAEQAGKSADPDLSIDYYQKALKVVGDDPDERDTINGGLAKSYFMKEDYANGLNVLEKLRDSSDIKNYYLGILYENGWGVTQDMIKSKAYYQKAADLGNPEASDRLAVWE